MRSELLRLRRMVQRTARSAWRTRVRMAALLPVAWVAGCADESVVDPPVVPPDAAPSAMAMAPASDRDILVALYHATDGPNWIRQDNWLTDAPVGDWYGVDTDASGRVVTLELGKWVDDVGQVSSGLEGAMPAALGGLTRLATLALPYNRLSGPIPPELGDLTNLERLDLSWNKLSGPIPPELGDLANLERLDLGQNQLSGSIPPELGNLANLRELFLIDGGDLTGPIPAELGGLAKLQMLHIGCSLVQVGCMELTGPIPPELGNLTSLWWLVLRSTRLSGPIPPELGNLANLFWLSLSHNELSGTIPWSFQQLALDQFVFDGNADLCVQDALVAWSQAIPSGGVGPVCPDRQVLRALYETSGGEGWTNASGWLADGPLSGWHGVDLDSLGLVSTVDLAGNGLSGGLPGAIASLGGLTALRIGDNDLTGRLPSALRLTPLRELRYANTALCAPVEAWFQEWLRSLPRHEGTGVQCPPLSDREILEAFYEATDGPNWEQSRNWLTGAPLGQWHGVTTDAEGRVVRLELILNRLKGPIPGELGGLAKLEVLGLAANQLSGSIPAELGGLASLKLLALHRNELSGSIPAELGGLTKAEWIALSINRLSGPIPAELGGLADLQELHLNNNELTSVPAELGDLASLKELALEFNRLTSVPGELGRLDSLQVLWILGNKLTSVPGELGELDDLRVLRLGRNRLTSVPPEFGRLVSLLWLDIGSNRLTSVPRELGSLTNLEALWLHSNELKSVPAELGYLGNLEWLALDHNRLSSVPSGLGGMESLELLELGSNSFASFPTELGALPNLYLLDLSGNRLTEVPTGLAGVGIASRLAWSVGDSPNVHGTSSGPRRPWGHAAGIRSMYVSTKADTPDTFRTRFDHVGNGSSDARSRGGGLAGLAILDLSSNKFSGSMPEGLLEFTGLTSLSLKDNTGLSGPLPLDLTALRGLEDLHTTGTELCAPPDSEFLDWLEGVTRQRVAHCERDGDAVAYLTQAVQSRKFPVPLVAGEPALLRVFVTAKAEAAARMPPVRATFYRDGAMTHQVEIPVASDPIPTAIDESSLSKSANAEIPGRVVQPGLEVVIEPDPDGTLDPALGVPRRIPARGRMAVDVRAMPVFEVTLVPFIRRERPDRSIVETVAAMAADPEGHELFERTHLLLPVSEVAATAHGPVLTSTNNGFDLLGEVEMIRVAEGGRGHYLAVMAPPTTPGGLGGVAYGIGSWSSFSILDSEVIAHEFGHNRNLYHAPCGGAGGPDRYYPYGEGNIGAWGFDFSAGELVPPGRSDFMSYCEPTWTSDYQFTNAVRYRLETETGSIVIAADAASQATGRALLLWGGLDGEGAPRLRPSFFMDAPVALPETDGPWRLTGEDSVGAALFSLSFAMAEFTDTDDERAGFSFAVPVNWTRELVRITLQGPGGSAVLDRDSDRPMTILRDPVMRRIRGVLEGPPAQADAVAAAAQAGAGAQNLQVLFSRGIPNLESEQR